MGLVILNYNFIFRLGYNSFNLSNLRSISKEYLIFVFKFQLLDFNPLGGSVIVQI